MAHLLNVESVAVAHAARTVLGSVSLGLDDGMRVGVVGRNGDGKSTLLRILARTQEPDAGRVTHTRGVRLAMLAQSDAVSASDVRHAVLGELAEPIEAAFQVDDLEADTLTGWSVLVRGTAEAWRGEFPDALCRPWAPGERTNGIQITPHSYSGRIVSGDDGSGGGRA